MLRHGTGVERFLFAAMSPISAETCVAPRQGLDAGLGRWAWTLRIVRSFVALSTRSLPSPWYCCFRLHVFLPRLFIITRRTGQPWKS
jgi:hypothetical protein